MRKDKTQATIIRVGLFIFAIVFLLCGIVTSLPKETCYSYEYSLYLKFKETTNIDEVREQLKSMKIEYSLKSNKLTLKHYENIVFDVLDDKKCLIASNTAMQSFERIDSGVISDMSFDGILEYDGIQETVTMEDDKNTYIKRNGNYFIETQASIIFPVFFFIIAAASAFLSYAYTGVKPAPQSNVKPKTKQSK